ncbi:MAG: diguanylate cyclase [Pseudomonadota bacterium]
MAWYFEAIERDKDFMADLGQIGDVHLYFDVKIYGPEREFLGYVGVGKRVQNFLDTFDQYKSRYGYDFLFVNDDDEIILSSLPDLVVRDAYIPTLGSLAWFSHEGGEGHSHDSEIIEVEDGDYLISEFGIEELGWRLLLLAPLEARQNQIVKAFLTNALVAAFSVTLLAGAGLFLVLVYKRSLENRTELDPLTGLPNRAHVQRRFLELQRAGVDLCAVIIDLDHFKQVNDRHGHETGDRVLRAAADALKQELREEDIVSRWGGEEFVMLIPAGTIELGQNIAERARQNIESLRIDAKRGPVSVTASFGVAFGSSKHEQLEALVAKADEVLYQAKEKGRNQVELYEAS